MPHEKTKSDNADSHARSAKAQKADEVQQAGSAKAGAGHATVPEGGPAPAPTRTKGKAMPASSTADGPDASPASAGGASPATAGKTEKAAAQRNAELTKDQHGRGHRKEH